MNDAPRETTVHERSLELLEAAPEGFVYPPQFLQIVLSDEVPEIDPWFFLCAITAFTSKWSRIVSEQFPDRNLVPFAKHDSTDDVFCFDADDHSGNPAVQIIHTFTTPGWEFRGQWKDFATFWEEAQETHEKWLRDEL